MRKSFSVVECSILSVCHCDSRNGGRFGGEQWQQSECDRDAVRQPARGATGNRRWTDWSDRHLQPSQSNLPCHCWSDGIDTT